MSWIKVKQALLDLSSSHPQINSFGSGDPSGIGTDNVVNFPNPTADRIVYPLCFADVVSASAQSRKMVLSVNVYFMDRIEDTRQVGLLPVTQGWKDNTDEVLSDMLQVAEDYISYFTDAPAFDYTLQEVTNLQRFVESRDDRVAGWMATMVFDIPFSRDICIIPG
jgi:hypothetical protein